MNTTTANGVLYKPPKVRLAALIIGATAMLVVANALTILTN